MEPNIQKYQALLKSVEAGSFTKAAEELGYTQSGISRMIRDIEDDWNIVLVERGKKGVVLTSDGEELLGSIRALCGSFSLLEQKVSEVNNLETGLIRIGTFSSVATHWIPNIIRHFHKDYPNIDYELMIGDYDDIEEWITSGRCDCGFVKLPCSNNLQYMKIERDNLLAVLPYDHPLAKFDKVPITEVEREPFMLLEKVSKDDISYIFKKYNIVPNVHFRTIDDYSIMSMVENGLGISVLPELILKRCPYHIAIRKLDVPAYREIGFAVKDMASSSAAVKRFVKYLDFRNESKME